MKTTTASLTDQAYATIKSNIQNCVYMPGEALSEKALCDDTECGRTPVREALLNLRREGLIEIFPRQGIRVASFTQQGVSEIYQIRKLLEPVVCKKYYLQFNKTVLLDFDRRFQEINSSEDAAYYGLDTEFHSWLVSVTKNENLCRFFDSIMQIQYRFGIYSSRIGTAVTQDYYSEHHRIIEALLAEDPDRIEAAILSHTNYSEVIALKTLAAIHADS